MALDNVAANSLKTVYALAHQPFSTDLKKELEAKIDNLQKRNQIASTVIPFTAEVLSEIKTHNLLVTHATEKLKKSNVATWVFLSLTIASIALAILAPMIALPLAAAFGILTITSSVFHVKNSTEKNKALTNLANFTIDHLPGLAKIQEIQKSPSENPFDILFRMTPAQISLNPSKTPSNAQNSLNNGPNPNPAPTTRNASYPNPTPTTHSGTSPTPAPTTDSGTSPTPAPTTHSASSPDTVPTTGNSQNNATPNNGSSGSAGASNTRPATPAQEGHFTRIELVDILNEALRISLGDDDHREPLNENSPIITKILSYFSNSERDQLLISTLFSDLDAITHDTNETNTIFANLIYLTNNGSVEPRFATIDDFMSDENGYLETFNDQVTEKLNALCTQIYGETNSARLQLITLIAATQTAVRYVVHTGNTTADDIKAALFDRVQSLISTHADYQPLGTAHNPINQAINALADALAANADQPQHRDEDTGGSAQQNAHASGTGGSGSATGHLPQQGHHANETHEDTNTHASGTGGAGSTAGQISSSPVQPTSHIPVDDYAAGDDN